MAGVARPIGSEAAPANTRHDAQRALHFDTLTPEDKTRLNLRLDEVRAELRGAGVEAVVSWNLATKQVQREEQQATRPAREDDHAGWQRYHEAQADLVARQPPGPTQADRIGQLQGEMDHRAEALGYQAQASSAQIRRAAFDETYQGDGALKSLGASAKTLEGLQSLAKADLATVRHLAADTKHIDGLRESHSTVSYEEAERAYRIGANRAVVSLYSEIKSSRDLTRAEPEDVRSYEAGRQYAALPEEATARIDFSKPPTIYRREPFERGVQDYQKENKQVPDRSREDLALARDFQQQLAVERPQKTQVLEPPTISPSWLEREANRIRIGADAAVSASDAALASAYWNGRREGFNGVREEVVRANPGLSPALPAAIRTDEIVVRQQVLEQEQRAHGRSFGG